MPPAPLPDNEAERLADLHSFALLDAQADGVVEEMVQLAARLSMCPIVLVSLVEQERQWFLARVGLDASRTSRDDALCAHAILDRAQPLAVADAAADPRFADSALVTREPHVRAYLGVPLVSAAGHALGTLCLIDRVPCRHDADTVRMLETLAHAVTSTLELRRALRRSQELAMTGGLTGLPNRQGLETRLGAMLGSGTRIAAVLLDLDHLSQVNDATGHAAGDALLRATAARLREVVRPCDIVARTGGDEFTVILVGMDDEAQARLAARRIAATLRVPVAHESFLLPLGATLGVALSPPGLTDADMLLRAADATLVRAKQDERGSIGWSGPEDAAQLLRRSTVLRAFDAAGAGLAGARAHLQPIVALGAHRAGSPVLAMEALARWSHPAVGEVSSAELFPILGPERTLRLGQAVRMHALSAMADLLRRGLPVGRLALNLFARDVARDDIAATIAQQVAAAGLALRDIEIEITEEVLLDRVSDATLQQLDALRGRGARLVLDDFGTGNSGLSQLLRLPLDAVKLDKRFVQGLGVDRRAEEIVRATISLAHGLDLEVVGEGVETMQQARMLIRMGCDAAQGFLCARPMPPEAVAEWLTPDRGLSVIPFWAARP